MMARARNKKAAEAVVETNYMIEEDNEIQAEAPVDAELAEIMATMSGETPETSDEDAAVVEQDVLDAYASQTSDIDFSAPIEPEADEPAEPAVEAEELDEDALFAEMAAPAPKSVKSVLGAVRGDYMTVAKTLLGPSPVLDANEGELSDDKVDAILGGVTQVKVREKVINTLRGAATGNVSNYTALALETLKLAGTGVVKNADIAKAMMEAGYSKGTAASQAGQQMTMLSALKIARRTKEGLTLNPDSVLYDALKDVAGSDKRAA